MVTRMLHIMCMSQARTFVLPPTVTSIRNRHWLRRRPKPVDDTLEWTAVSTLCYISIYIGL